jgi:hypothetical protein
VRGKGAFVGAARGARWGGSVDLAGSSQGRAEVVGGEGIFAGAGGSSGRKHWTWPAARRGKELAGYASSEEAHQSGIEGIVEGGEGIFRAWCPRGLDGGGRLGGLLAMGAWPDSDGRGGGFYGGVSRDACRR